MTIDLEKFKINYMQPVSFEGAKEIGKPKGMTDEQCMSIWASSGVTAEGFPFFLEAWKPNYDDLQALNRGEPIYIQILSNGLPPISVFTIDFQQQSLNTTIEAAAIDLAVKELNMLMDRTINCAEDYVIADVRKTILKALDHLNTTIEDDKDDEGWIYCPNCGRVKAEK